MDPEEADREELEDRVAELEQTVSKMLPDRRGVLKGLGAAAVGGAAVGASSGGASGQSAAGQVGTESAPVDVEGAQGNFNSVSTAEEYVGGHPKRTTVGQDQLTEIYVDPAGDDSNDGTSTDPLATVQEAVDRFPVANPGQFKIILADGTYPEHVLVGGGVASATPTFESGSARDGVNATWIIEGDRETPGNVEINSISAAPMVGANALAIRGVTILENTAYDNDNAGIIAYGGEMTVRDCAFGSNVTIGIDAYRSDLDIRNTDFSTLKHGVLCKHGNVTARDCTGSTTEEVYHAVTGGVITFFNNSATGTSTATNGSNGLVYTNQGGLILDADAGILYGAESVNRRAAAAHLSVNQSISSGTSTRIEFDAQPSYLTDYWDTVNHEYVAPTDGVYRIRWTGRFTSVSDGTAISGKVVTANGTEALKEKIAGGNGEHSIEVEKTVELAAGSVVWAEVEQDQGVNLDLTGASTTTHIDVELLRSQ